MRFIYNSLSRQSLFGITIFSVVLIGSCSSTNPTPKFYEPSVKNSKPNTSEQFKAQLNNKIYTPKASIKKTGKSTAQKDTKGISNYPAIYGVASWYGPGFHGKKTASGEIYDENSLTVAHRTLPLGTSVRITNLENQKTVVARVNDRGPFIGDRVLDGSKRVAEFLDYKSKGLAKVKIQVLDNDSKLPPATVIDFNKANRIGDKNLLSNTNFVPRGSLSQNAHVVQLGAFAIKQNAYNYRDGLTNRFQELQFLINLSRNKYFQVFVGPFKTKQQAQQVAGVFDKQGVTNIVRYYGDM